MNKIYGLVVAASVAFAIVLNPMSARSEPAKEPAVEPQWAGTGAEEPTIPYFSAAGQAYVDAHRLPRPPFFRHGSTEEADPPRNVPATSWDGPFCKEWTDECARCVRSGDQHLACAPANGLRQSCHRHAVTCTAVGPDQDDLAYKHCRVVELHRIERFGNSERDINADQVGVTWYFARRDQRWHFYMMEDAYLPQYPGPGKPRPPKPDYGANDWRCIEAIGTPRSKSYDVDPDLKTYDPDPVIER